MSHPPESPASPPATPAPEFESVACGTLTLTPLVMECYALPETARVHAALIETLHTDIARLWPSLRQELSAQRIPDGLGIARAACWEMDLTWVDDAIIAQINAHYRNKPQATDVLTFSLLADQPEALLSVWRGLPEVQLGSVFVSIDWALAQTGEPADGSALRRYLLERVIHGCLHLMGAHHDTMADYERVKSVQDRVLADWEALAP